MKIRPKVPVCTDCDHVFEYKGQNPGQLGGVVVQFGESYCTKKKKPRLLKRWHNLLRVPDWCKKRIRPSLMRIYDFASTESWLMHENLCKSLGREIGPTASRYTLSEVRQLDLDAYAFQRQARTTPVEDILNVHLGLHQVVEVFDGVQSVILYKTLDGFIPAPTFDAERARQNRREQKKATAGCPAGQAVWKTGPAAIRGFTSPATRHRNAPISPRGRSRATLQAILQITHFLCVSAA